MAADHNEPMKQELPTQGVARLTDWGVIRARGVDAQTFLQGQLTQDLASLPPGQARLAGYCSAKGRLLASFVAWRGVGDEWLLACSADLLAATLKRLSMFVLRAKVVLDDASAELPLHGLVGRAVPEIAVWSCQVEPTRTSIRLPDAMGLARALCAGEPPAGVPELPHAQWSGLEARSGVARIAAATSELFVPQMVNFDAVGGLSFSKGCYPGQEVVARSHYRGTVKRRGFVVEASAAMAPGQAIFDPAAPSEPAGQIVLAGDLGAGHAGFAELKIAAAGLPLTLGSAEGPALTVVELPYPLPAEPA